MQRDTIDNTFGFYETLFAAADKTALTLLASALCVAMLIVAAGAIPASATATASGAIVGAIILFYGINASGYRIAQVRIRGSNEHTIAPGFTASVWWSMTHAHAVLYVMGVTLISLALCVAVAGFVLTLCITPIGVNLYAVVLPMLIAFLGMVVIVASVTVLLAAPAVWAGRSAHATFAVLVRRYRTEATALSCKLFMLSLLVLSVCVAVVVVLGAGSILTGALTNAIMFSNLHFSLAADKPFNLAGNIGSIIVWAFGAMAPLLVLLAGLDQVGRVSLADVEVESKN